MTINHPVITNVGVWGNPAHESLVVKALAGAGQATSPGRSIKRSLQLRYTAHVFRNRGTCGCRADADKVAPDKTKTIRFGRNGGPHNGRFDFLGFEYRW